jgi:mRNA interferase MazF
MVIVQGEVWWADLGDPLGSAAGYIRPIVVVQGDKVNRSNIETVICIPLTGNLKWARIPGNLFLSATETGLERDSAAQTPLILAVDKAQLRERVGQISASNLGRLLNGLDVLLGRS